MLSKDTSSPLPPIVGAKLLCACAEWNSDNRSEIWGSDHMYCLVAVSAGDDHYRLKCHLDLVPGKPRDAEIKAK